MGHIIKILMILPVIWAVNVNAGGGFGEPGLPVANSLVIIGSAVITESTEAVGYTSIHFVGVCRGEDINSVIELVPDEIGVGGVPFSAFITKDQLEDLFISGDLSDVIKGNCNLDGANIIGLAVKNIGKLDYDMMTNSYAAKGVLLNPLVN